jgi:serine/threonine protein kinase/tetratricopeptide (TPR) repeat protein
MQNSNKKQDPTSAIVQKPFDKSAIKIHNILPSIERTFLKIGSTIGKYNIIEEIDRGGMAVVYKALQLDLDREVALKVLPANITINHRFVERFLSEAHAVARLQHPYIVNIHEVAVENNVYFLAMDYIPGMNLYYYLNLRKPKLVDVLEITVKLLEALAYAHKQKIIHRDLKLNNIIMRDNITPVLIDFGLAKALEGEEVAITRTGEIMGSPAYMAPERLSGANTDARSDICSMGIVLYEMLTFKNPYLDPRSMPQTTMNVMEANPIPPRKLVPWLPAEIEAITLKAMAKDPQKRYQTMDEFRDDLRRYQKGEPVLANPPSLWSIGKHLWHTYWAILVIGLLTIAFSSLFAFYLYFNNKKEQPFWHVSYQEKISDARSRKDWSFHREKMNGDSFQWSIENNALCSPDSGYSFARLERVFSRDVRIEFDIKSKTDHLSDVGFFLNGSCPDSGYCFHIHKGPQAQCGISFPGSDFLFSDYNPYEFILGNSYHISIEKKDNAMTFRINDKFIAKIWDFLPVVGKNHRHIGFFVNGTTCNFNNIIVSTYTFPQLRGPCVVANNFAQRGEFRNALDEYEEIFPEFAATDVIGEILLRMCDCRIRLGQYEQATKLLQQLKYPMGKKDALIPCRLFFEGVIDGRTGSRPLADSAFSHLFKIAPESPLCQSAQSSIIMTAAEEMKRGNCGLAEQTMTVIRTSFQGNQKASGKLFLMIMERYLQTGDLDKAKAVGGAILSFCKSEQDVISAARINLARLSLAKGDKTAAIDFLNQCIASLIPSEATWQAWLELAGIYEYDANFSDAFTIYKKVFSDCPKHLMLSWMARLKMGEIADRVTSEEHPKNIFTSVITSPHPFLFPRRIAQFYKGEISKEEFKKFWLSMYHENNGYLDYYGRKSLIDHEPEQALDYFESFKQSVAPNTWTAIQLNKMLSLLQK